MPDIATISAFLGSIKTATELAKAIKGADLSLENAEIKLKMADLVSALADAKIQAAEIQELVQEKDKKILELENALELKPNLIRRGLAYYETDETGKPVGDAFCSYCWEVNHKVVHIHHRGDLSSSKICPLCKNEYDIGLTSAIS